MLAVHRLGAMRITGNGIWGPSADPAQARNLLREAVRLGVDFIDTAVAYGPEVSERLIAEALYPYPEGLVIATKGGVSRTGSRTSATALRSSSYIGYMPAWVRAGRSSWIRLPFGSSK